MRHLVVQLKKDSGRAANEQCQRLQTPPAHTCKRSGDGSLCFFVKFGMVAIVRPRVGVEQRSRTLAQAGVLDTVEEPGPWWWWLPLSLRQHGDVQLVRQYTSDEDTLGQAGVVRAKVDR